jgi:hypothetical protein
VLYWCVCLHMCRHVHTLWLSQQIRETGNHL